MARTSAVKRSKSTRRSNSASSSTVSAGSGAARRRSVKMYEPSSASSTSQEDDTRRKFRRRVSNQKSNACEADNRKPAAAERRTARNKSKKNQQQSAAAIASSCSSTKMDSESKKEENSLSVSVGTTMNASGVAHAPLTRSQRRKLNQVTPSPAQASAVSSFGFDDSTPPTKRQKSKVFDLSPRLPPGVTALYPRKGAKKTQSASSIRYKYDDDVCSSKSQSAAFIQVYGEEFYSAMKSNDKPIIDALAPSPSHSSSQESQASGHPSIRSNSSSRVVHSPDPERLDEESLATEEGSPNFRRVWGPIDMDKIAPAKAVESSKFLEYQPELNPKMRSILMDWIIELSEHFNFGHSTLHLAITLVDEVLACGPLSFDDEFPEDGNRYNLEDESKTNCFVIPRERFQLLGATCTWLACKMEEQQAPKVSQIAYVSDNIYSVEQIKRMERRVCNALGFALTRQTPYPYIQEFIRASTECTDPECECPPVFKYMVHYLLELGRLPYLPVTKKPSLLAAAAVYLARVTLGIGGGDWTPTLEHYTGFPKQDLKEVVICLHGHQIAAEESSLKSVFDKYRSKKYRRVALKTVPLVDDLGF